MRCYDITRPIQGGMPVYPGDPEVTVRPWLSLAQGDSVNVSLLALGSHTGTHVDAPCHLQDGAAGVDRLALDALLGPALVVEVEPHPCVEAADLHRLDVLALGGHLRLLLKTRVAGSQAGQLAALSPEAARLLVEAGVRLIGVEGASVDPASASDLPAHRLLLGAGVVVLENLDLSAVPPGRYELLCLPLKIEGGDGAPLRALLRDSADGQHRWPAPRRRGRRAQGAR
ncbi:MAG TPA: cyclase family protein [Candidatus Sulfotelmatobacter sp.]|nr:cyclase family protein [Candidatus Sulfotelmatobacter sp.]